jgi:hypothetical protein
MEEVLQNNKNDRLIIDMRESTRDELFVLSTILLNLNTILSSQGFKITLKKSSKPVPQSVSLSSFTTLS